MSKRTETAAPATETQLLTIDELAEKHRVSAAVLAGIKAAQGWADGLSMTDDQFLKARDRWLRSGIR